MMEQDTSNPNHYRMIARIYQTGEKLFCSFLYALSTDIRCNSKLPHGQNKSIYFSSQESHGKEVKDEKAASAEPEP